MPSTAKPTASLPRNPHKPSPFNPLDSQLPLLTADSPVTDYLPWLQYAQEELDRSGINSNVMLMPHPLSFKNEQDKVNTTMAYQDADGNEGGSWNTDMMVCRTISQIMTAPLQGKRHRVGLLVSPAPWVGVRREAGVDENGEEFVTYKPAHASLFFVVAASPGKPGKTLAIWDADAEGEISRKVQKRRLQEPLQVREGLTGIQYHLYSSLINRAALAGIYVGGAGNEGRTDCGPLAVDALLSWVRGEQGELSATNLGEMGQHKLAK